MRKKIRAMGRALSRLPLARSAFSPGLARRLRESGLFDAAHYLAQTPESERLEAEADPVGHYLRRGAALGLSPAASFDPRWYLWKNPDVGAAGLAAFAHFVLYGQAEGRAPAPPRDVAPSVGPWETHGRRESFLTGGPAGRMGHGPFFGAGAEAPGASGLDDAGASGPAGGDTFGPADEGASGFGDAGASGLGDAGASGRGRGDGSDTESGNAAVPVARQPKALLSVPVSPPPDPDLPRDGAPVAAVTFVSGLPGTASHAYRVAATVEALRDLGCQAFWIDAAEAEAERAGPLLAFSDIVALYRVPLGPGLRAAVTRARAAGARIVFDCDDLVFEPGLSDDPEVVDGARRLDAAGRAELARGVAGYRQTLLAADFGLFSTEALAARARRLGLPSARLANTPDAAFLAASQAARSAGRDRGRDGPVRLGYASGTLTHQKDFGLIVPVLTDILARFPHVRLTVLGRLDLSEFPALAGFGERLEARPAVAREALPAELARFDLNLAPLDHGNPFCAAKSEVKVLEAALVGVPSVASPTEAYGRAVEHGRTGFLADGPAGWRECLERLLGDPAARREMGRRALRAALESHGPAARRAALADILPDILAAPARGPLGDGRSGTWPAAPEAVARPDQADMRPDAAGAYPCPAEGRPGPAAGPRRVAFVLPAPSRGGGGQGVVLSLAGALAARGAAAQVVFTAPPPAGTRPADAFRDLGLPPGILASFAPRPLFPAEATVATFWETVEAAERAGAPAGRRFHFVQDDEAAFYPMGTQALGVGLALGRDFVKIAYGPWMARTLAERYGQASRLVPMFLDRATYDPESPEGPRQRLVVAFYRADMPRRCPELALAALFELTRRLAPDPPRVVLFGTPPVPGETWPANWSNAGVLAPAELAGLYARAAVGLAMSTTNPSLVPYEMMAMGLPVVGLDVAGNADSYGAPEAMRLCRPDPMDMASALAGLLADPAARRDMGRAGRKRAASMASLADTASALADILAGPRPS